MSPQNARALALLHILASARLRFLVYGSAGQGLLDPTFLDGYTLPDVDVLLADVGGVRPLVDVLQPRGFAFTVWGDPLPPDWREEDLAGKIYLRGRQGVRHDALQLDATFEGAPFDVADAFARAVVVGGIPVCPPRELWIAKRRKSQR